MLGDVSTFSWYNQKIKKNQKIKFSQFGLMIYFTVEIIEIKKYFIRDFFKGVRPW